MNYAIALKCVAAHHSVSDAWCQSCDARAFCNSVFQLIEKDMRENSLAERMKYADRLLRKVK